MSKLTTYAETTGEQPFDWAAFLKKETITADEWKEATELAADWVTCACGNQCAIIPRETSGAPQDNILYRLGSAFYFSIKHRSIGTAKQLLIYIEARSAKLIAELTSKAPEI